jgi:succinate dehydrogenase/fumarate reductase flavoprotein subunit
MVAIADNLHDLAFKMSVDSAGLQATVLRYNSLADARKDSDFGKPAPFKRIASPPFYAIKMALMKHTRRNGIRVNTHGQVLDRSDFIGDMAASPRNSVDEESVIPRLYAAGECANYLGRSHGHGTLGIYSFYGRIAGKNAAAESQLQ